MVKFPIFTFSYLSTECIINYKFTINSDDTQRGTLNCAG